MPPAADPNKTAFIRFMLEAGALKFGDFKTKSGRNSPYFINTGAYRTGSQLEKLGEFYARALVQAHGREVDNLFGPAYKGIPLAVAAATALTRIFNLDVSYTFNRKEVKDHGEGGGLVGLDYASWDGPAPCRVVLIEDVTTAGTSVRESLPWIQGGGKARAVGLVVAVDRMEKGTGEKSALQEIRETFGLRTTAIVSFADLSAYLETPEGGEYARRDAGLLERMQRYHENYGASG
jgi:orotate phosphoribosyltransferase